MERVSRKINLPLPVDIAFHKFVNELNEWWPKEYSWSQDKLREINIDGRMGGLCTEIGPHGFRCDWGRVTEFSPPRKIALKWQISHRREPIPDPDGASDLMVSFKQEALKTTLVFEHFNFENHGDASGDYRKMMDSEQGWDYILSNYKHYCERA